MQAQDPVAAVLAEEIQTLDHLRGDRNQCLSVLVIAGVLAVLAPTVGPTVGGYITQTYSWPWLFLINVLPGILAVGVGAWLLLR